MISFVHNKKSIGVRVHNCTENHTKCRESSKGELVHGEEKRSSEA